MTHQTKNLKGALKMFHTKGLDDKSRQKITENLNEDFSKKVGSVLIKEISSLPHVKRGVRYNAPPTRILIVEFEGGAEKIYPLAEFEGKYLIVVQIE